MKKNLIHLLKKSAISIFIAVQIVALNVPVASAFLISTPSASKELSKGLKTLHIDKGAAQDFGEGFNVSSNKSFAPEVRVLFSPQDPQPGQKITARAFAQFFTNTNDSLYFTWYLKRSKCVNENRSFTEINGTVESSDGCDYDGNGEYDINDMKIEAARIIAGDGFDVRYADDDGAPDQDDDGYVAFPGGDNKRSAIGDFNPYYYYIHDFNSGKNYEIVDNLSQEEIFPTCADPDKVPVCVADEPLVCSAPQITKNISKSERLEVEATGGTGTGGAGGGTDTGGAGGTGTGGTVSGQQIPSSVISTSLNQTSNQFDICKVVGAPTCTALVTQSDETNPLTGQPFEDVEEGGLPTCENGEIPVCVDRASLQYPVDELQNRIKNLSALPTWPRAAQKYGVPADPAADGYVVEPNGFFTEFQCTDPDIDALVSFWPPPTASLVDADGQPLSAADIIGAEAVDAFSESYVLNDFYSCAAELYGRNYNGVTSDGKGIFDEADVITTCVPQDVTADSFQRFHLFPRNDKGEQVGEPEGVGDPGFVIEDELFYHTDPFDKDTADNRINDEATVVGLGQDSFSWIYTPGDEVGVIVEGTSMTPTKHPDSSNMIMIATVNNACDYAGMVNNSVPSVTASYSMRIRGFNVKIPAIAFVDGPEAAFNTCLTNSENAFISPAQGGAAKKLEIGLSVSPENPINDATNSVLDGGAKHINMGDTVTVGATITNAKYKSDRLRYKWSIAASADGSADFDPNNWDTIAGFVGNDSIGRGVFDFPEAEITPLSGNGLSEISFKLNLRNDLTIPLPDGTVEQRDLFVNGADFTYLRVRASVEEDFDLLSQELHEYDVSRGRADIIFRITRASNKLQVYTVTDAAQVRTDGLGDNEMNRGALVTCEDEPGQLAVCPVVKNQLLKLVLDRKEDGSDEYSNAAQYSNYRWKVNDKPLYKPAGFACRANEADAAESVCNFLPITGEPGTEYIVSVSANSIGEVDGTYGSGKAVEVSRKFVVVDPYVSFCDKRQIGEDPAVTGESQCKGIARKAVAFYESDTETSTEYSDRVFLAPPYTSPIIFGSARPRWIADQTDINWFMEGVYSNTVGSLLTIDGTQKNPGESTNIVAKAVYQPAPSVRQLMRDTWNMTDQQLMPLHFDSPVQIEYAEGVEVTQSAPEAFLAALSVNAPGTVLFLFRIFLAVGVVVFFVGLLWRFLPDSPRRPHF